MKTLSAAAISGALLVASTLLIPSPAVAVDTCHGQPATVTPDVDGHLLGTPLADVIVAHDGQTVDAGLGDDLICLVATQPVGPVDAGGGEDTVDATQSTASSRVSLGLGEDSYVGGPGRDVVHGAADGSPGSTQDTELDDIATAGGNDKVFSGTVGSPNSDQIATGAGDDRIDLVGLDPTLSLDAGSGRNTAIVTLTADETSSWLIDVAKRKIHVDDVTSHWQGSLHHWFFTLADGSARSSVVFLGTAANETAFVSGALVPHFRLGGGDDRAGSLTAKGGTIFLGSGHDQLTLGSYDPVEHAFSLADLRVDLAARKAIFGKVEAAVIGVESLHAGAERLRVFGSDRADLVAAHGCDVVVDGRAGDDVLTRGADGVDSCDDLTNLLVGAQGSDRLVGSSSTDDVLLGGKGFDRARGLGGVDTCAAEITRGCETP